MNTSSNLRFFYNRFPWQVMLPCLLSLTILFGAVRTQAQNVAPDAPVPEIGTSAIFGNIDGVAIEGKVQSPSNQPTPLQIVCIFEYTEGDMTSPQALPPAANGLLHVDEALHGLITELRKSGRFAGHTLETLLITPPKGSIPAEKLLLIGLGDRNNFNAGVMTNVGKVGMREALRLGVNSYSHASDLKDAGIDSPTGLVAQNVVKGALEAYETELYLKEKGLATFNPLTKVTLLAGQKFFGPTAEAIRSYINNRPKAGN